MRFRGFELGYCTNVHPGETLADIEQAIATHVTAVRDQVAPGLPFGTGLRLGHRAVTQLLQPDAQSRLVATLEAADLYVFTVNGFPYGDFAADAVKAAVYAPSWLDDERVKYTLELAQVVAGLPGPAHRTISTVAGGFRPQTDTAAAHAQIAQNLTKVSQGLADLADQTGVSIRLCLEPEPWTMLETTADAIQFFTGALTAAGALIKDHLGLCYDCCHQAVHFENPGQSVAQLLDAGVPIGKVQVSSALHLDTPSDPAQRARLLAFAEPRYLHQVVGQTDGELLRALDLPELINPSKDWLAAHAWRCHFHVPIWWRGDGVLSTTRTDWEATVQAIQAQNACTHLEIETYTWSVLPQEAHIADDLIEGIAAEFAALKAVL